MNSHFQTVKSAAEKDKLVEDFIKTKEELRNRVYEKELGIVEEQKAILKLQKPIITAIDNSTKQLKDTFLLGPGGAKTQDDILGLLNDKTLPALTQTILQVMKTGWESPKQPTLLEVKRRGLTFGKTGKVEADIDPTTSAIDLMLDDGSNKQIFPASEGMTLLLYKPWDEITSEERNKITQQEASIFYDFALKSGVSRTNASKKFSFVKNMMKPSVVLTMPTGIAPAAPAVPTGIAPAAPAVPTTPSKKKKKKKGKVPASPTTASSLQQAISMLPSTPVAPSTSRSVVPTLTMEELDELTKDIQIGSGMKTTAHKKKNPYKLEGNRFGDIEIDRDLLVNHLRLRARKNGKVILSRKVSPDFIDLLTKRYNPRLMYTDSTRDTFQKLVKISGLPIQRGNGKFKMIFDDPIKTGGCQNDPQELVERLDILFGSIGAGNNSKLVKNEAIDILDKLLTAGIITAKEHAILYNENIL